MIDATAAREGYQNKDIDNIRYVRSESNVADGLTKAYKQRSLPELLTTSSLIPTVDQ